LPGFSLSMVSQARDYFAQTQGETFGFQWPWASDVLEASEGAPEAKAVAMVCDHAQSTILQGSANKGLLQALERYLKRPALERAVARKAPDLPEPGAVIGRFVRQLKVV
jgi:hypothetical protein